MQFLIHVFPSTPVVDKEPCKNVEAPNHGINQAPSQTGPKDKGEQQLLSMEKTAHVNSGKSMDGTGTSAI